MLRTKEQNKRIYGIIGEIKNIFFKKPEKHKRWAINEKSNLDETINTGIDNYKQQACERISGQPKSSLLTFEQAEMLIKDLLNLKEYFLYIENDPRAVWEDNNILQNKIYEHLISYKLINTINQCYKMLDMLGGMPQEARFKLQKRILKDEKIRNNSDAVKVYEALKSMICRKINFDTALEWLKYILSFQDKLTDWEKKASWDFYSQILNKGKLDSPQKIRKLIEIYQKAIMLNNPENNSNEPKNDNSIKSKEVILFSNEKKECMSL